MNKSMVVLMLLTICCAFIYGLVVGADKSGNLRLYKEKIAELDQRIKAADSKIRQLDNALRKIEGLKNAIKSGKYELRLEKTSAAVYPYTITWEMLDVVANAPKGEDQIIVYFYEYMGDNLNYDNVVFPRKIRSASATFDKKEGVCQETAYLAVTFYRLCGLEAKVAKVILDDRSKRVQHACAVVYKKNREIVLVDHPYQRLDVKHEYWVAYQDQELIPKFQNSFVHAQSLSPSVNEFFIQLHSLFN